MKNLILLFFIACSFSVLGSGWLQKADFGGIARHRSTGFSIGNKAYLGLGHYNGAGTNVLFNDWWEYDPATNSWTQKADYMGGGCYHATGFVIGNYGYVGTGRVSAIGSTLVQDFYRYDPTTNSWNTIPPFPGEARRAAVAFEVNNLGYVGTGETNFGNASDFFKYNPTSNSWSTVASFPGSPRGSAVAFSIDGLGYVGTGNTNFGSTNDFWQYNPVSNTWLQRANVGPTNRQEAAGFALNGYGYIGTGDNFSSGTNYKDMWQYLPATNSWIQIENFQGTARRYLSAFTLGNYAYAGLGTNGTNFKDFWVFDQTLSLLEQNINTISTKIYPNPSNGMVQLKLDVSESLPNEELQVVVYSQMGQIIYKKDISHGIHQMDLTSAKAGFYICSIELHGKPLLNDQLIIQ